MKRINDANEFDINVTWESKEPEIEVEYDHEVVEDTDSDIILTAGSQELVMSVDVYEQLKNRVYLAEESLIGDPIYSEWKHRIEADETFSFLL